MPKKNTYLKLLEKDLGAFHIEVQQNGNTLLFRHHENSIEFLLAAEGFVFPEKSSVPLLPFDYLITQRQKTIAILRSKLRMNTTVFARSCSIQKITKQTAIGFLDCYHVMQGTQSAFNYGLFFKDELIAVATFSKGRKMNRLEESQRSFELIRFCCKDGITVTGGLTKLVKNFCRDKKAGDIMTYVDKQFSDGKAFITAGFKHHSETPPNYFLVNKSSFKRTPVQDAGLAFDSKAYYLAQNAGNIKMIYTPDEAV